MTEVRAMSTIEPASSTAESTVVPRVAPSPRDAIEAANARFMAAFGTADPAAIAACYTADAQLLPANSDLVSGKEAIARFWGGALASGIAGARLETAEVEARDDLAVEVGRYSLTAADGGMLDNGKYVVVWHQDAGSWKMHRDIWTTNRPAPGA
jgi:uncharacterized protein (TIGR02246 family)